MDKHHMDMIRGIRPLDEAAMQAARAYQHTLVKPAGSLGKLEDLTIRFAGITGSVKNRIDRKVHYVLGADNGVYEEGVAASPQSFTRLLMGFYASGDIGCGISVLCRKANVDLKIVDMGVKGGVNHPAILNRRLMDGTGNFYRDRAMTEETVWKAIGVGLALASDAKHAGYDIIGTGEVGMANTTTAAACIAAALGLGSNAAGLVGRGAGLTDEAFARKQEVIVASLLRLRPDAEDAADILSKVGGLDIAGLCGLFLGAAYHRIPIVIDGVISIAAALLACKLNPLAREYMIPSHLSEEPAYALAANRLELEPFLHLDMRLGEGTGCPIAMQIVEDALEIICSMSTFEQAQLQSAYREELKT